MSTMHDADADSTMPPVTFSQETLHSVANQLAIIVSYIEMMLPDLAEGDVRRQDVLEMRKAVHAIAALLGRPMEDE